MDIETSTAMRRFLDRATGTAVRHARDRRGLTRRQLTKMMPSGVTDRTLLSYEDGSRQMTIARFIEICDTMNESAPEILRRGLQEAALLLENLVLHVDLEAVLNDKNMRFRPLVQWASHLLADQPDGVAPVTPSAVRNMAAVLGCTHDELARYLAKFMPDPEESHIA
jgi:hypothetical protein